ncbi:MAG: transposase [Anaerolineales bacterium]|nr:transposase [Anaerolineales bacterium]
MIQTFSSQAASLAAFIGDPAHYTEAAQVFRRSGLVSDRNDSGNHQRKGRGTPILKSGDVCLRRNLMNAVSSLLVHQPALYCTCKRLALSKPAGVARVATARKAIGLRWAAQRDQFSNPLIQWNVLTCDNVFPERVTDLLCAHPPHARIPG